METINKNKNFTMRKGGQYMVTLKIEQTLSVHDITLILLIKNINIDKISKTKILPICRDFLKHEILNDDSISNIELEFEEIITFENQVRDKLNIPEDRK